MAKWQVDLYTLDGLGGIAEHYQVDSVMLSGKLVKTVDDTAKLTFSVPMSAFSGAFANILPMKAYVNVHRIGTTTKKFYCGLIEKRTLSLANMTYTYECCGGLGAQKYIVPYRNFPSGSTIDTVIDALSARYRGTAQSPYTTFNPSETIYTNVADLLHFGEASYSYYGLEFNESLANIQKSSATAYDFYKSFLDTNNFVWFSNFDAPHLFEREDGSIHFGSIVESHPNTQEIRYDRNLVSCEITDESYPTIVAGRGTGLQAFKLSPEYPFPFGFLDVTLPDKSGGGTYTGDELKAAAEQVLYAPHQIISAVGFDEGILDNGTPFLNIEDPVYLVYLENNIEKRILANITSITYDLTNPSRDRVQLGKKVIPLTQRS